MGISALIDGTVEKKEKAGEKDGMEFFNKGGSAEYLLGSNQYLACPHIATLQTPPYLSTLK